MSSGEPKAKKFKHSIISEHVLSKKFQSVFRKHWANHMSIKGPNMELIAEPFRVGKISNFIRNETFMDELKSELADVHCKRIDNDLYQFEQTSDLVNYGSESLVSLHNTFRTEIATWMENVTNIELDSTISMTGTCYYDGDYLLCHDDNVGNRKIAFILYLTLDWTVEDGGTLDLFDTDEKGLPRNIARSLIPEYNSLIFFEVSDNSYHQVAEVTSTDFSRWTINGWFHGPKRISQPPRPEILYEYIEPIDSDVDLSYWLMDSYLCVGIVSGIQNEIERKSYAYLSQFIKEKVYTQLSNEILSDSIKWKKVGPPNLRNYEVADETSLSNMFKDFLQIFKSLQFFTLLKRYTQLDLVPDGQTMRPKMTLELQRWSKGCYTLICDKSTDDNATTDEENGEDENPSTNYSSNICEDLKIDRQSNDILNYDECKEGKNDEKVTGQSDWMSDNDNNDDDKVLRYIMKDKKPKDKQKKNDSEEASCSKSEDYDKRSPPLNPDSEDSEVSDIGDYLSDSSRDFNTDDDNVNDNNNENDDNNDDDDDNDDNDDNDDEKSISESGILELLFHFHTSEMPDGDTIDYIDPKETDGSLIHLTPEDNHLCLVYRMLNISRFQKYVNHYCDGYFYTLLCTYHEK